MTYFGPDRAEKMRNLYMCGAWEDKAFDRAHSVAVFSADRPPQADIAKFNTYGARLIHDSLSWAEIIIMDECGGLETNAGTFVSQVLSCLDGGVPVLGVIKKTASPAWTDRIKSHPLVKVIAVTEDNRDERTAEILENLRQSISEKPQPD